MTTRLRAWKRRHKTGVSIAVLAAGVFASTAVIAALANTVVIALVR